MKTLFTLQLINILDRTANNSKSNKLDVSSKSAIASTFNSFIKLGTDIYGRPFASKLSKEGIHDALRFEMMLSSDNFKQTLSDDVVGKKVLNRIKYPTAAKVAKEMNEIHEKYKNQMTSDKSEVDDIEQTYAIRTKSGEGPVTFVKGVRSDTGRHEVRRWYAWQNNINYFDVRECSYEYWSNNPETQISTNN